MHTLLTRLKQRQSAGFVGRTFELNLFQTMLRDCSPLLFITGAPGIGKTALISKMVELASPEYNIVQLDFRNTQATPEVVLANFAKALGLAIDDIRIVDLVDALAGMGKTLIIFDSVEQISEIEQWLRDALIAELPDSCSCIIASRQLPDETWSLDPVWDEAMQVVNLQPLSESEARQLIANLNLPDCPVQWIWTTSEGNPLFLKLLVKQWKSGRTVGDEVRTCALGEFNTRITAYLPTQQHQDALFAAAIARRTRPELLADVIPDAAGLQLYDWLKKQSLFCRDSLGIYPTNLMREAILNLSAVEAMQRYVKVSRKIGTHLLRWTAKDGPDPHTANMRALETLYSSRHTSEVASNVDVEAIDYFEYGTANIHQQVEICNLARSELGATQFELFQRWIQEPSASLWFVKNKANGRVEGGFLVLDAPQLKDCNLEFDPLLMRVLDSVDPPRVGHPDTIHRFVFAEGGMRTNKKVAHGVIAAVMLQMFSVPKLHRVFGFHQDPDHWHGFMNALAFLRLAEFDHSNDNKNFGIFSRNFSVNPFGSVSWSFINPSQPKQSIIEPKYFEQELKELLKVLNYPATLEASPIAKLPFVLMGMMENENPGTTLRRMILEEIEALAGHPKTERSYRALATTFLETDMTQEAAAETLGLPFGTYRYQLQSGITKLCKQLLDRAGIVAR